MFLSTCKTLRIPLALTCRCLSFHAAAGATPRLVDGMAVLGTPPTPRAAAARHRTDWSAGAGAELQGPIECFYCLTGRTTTALPHLSGPGVQAIIERSAIPRAEADQS